MKDHQAVSRISWIHESLLEDAQKDGRVLIQLIVRGETLDELRPALDDEISDDWSFDPRMLYSDAHRDYEQLLPAPHLLSVEMYVGTLWHTADMNFSAATDDIAMWRVFASDLVVHRPYLAVWFQVWHLRKQRGDLHAELISEVKSEHHHGR